MMGVNAVDAKDIDQKVLGIYLRNAFADTKQIVKFTSNPSVSIYCGADECNSVAKQLKGILKGATIVRSEPEGRDANIEIFLFSNADERENSLHKYFAKADEKIGGLTHRDCALVQSRRGFEVVKVIVAVAADSGVRENIICVLSEVLRGSGVSVQGRYPEYLKGYLGMDESQFALVLNGFSILIAIHFLEITSPGQDEETVARALKDKFLSFGDSEFR